MSIQEFMQTQIKKGKDNQQIAAAAAKKFPDAKSTEAQHVAWARWKMKQKKASKKK